MANEKKYINTMRDNIITIKPTNEQGQRHGFWHQTNSTGQFYFKCHYVNDVQVGYYEHLYISDSGKVNFEFYAR